MIFGLSWEEVAAIAVPIVTATFFIVRHIWHNSIDKYDYKLRITQLEKESEAGEGDHKEMFKDFDTLNNRITVIETKLDMLLKKLLPGNTLI